MTHDEIEEHLAAIDEWTTEVAGVLNTIVDRVNHLSSRVQDLNARVSEFKVDP